MNLKGQTQGKEQNSLNSNLREAGRTLARYTIALGSNEAVLEFVGDGPLLADDFDAVVESVGLFKTQHERRMRANAPQVKTLTLDVRREIESGFNGAALTGPNQNS